MSRFFAASESDTESSESDEEIQQKPTGGAGARAFQFSDDEDTAKRIVRSAKDKRYDEMRNIIKGMKNHKKIKDMSNILSDFEELVRAFDKSKKVVEKEGVPRFYIRCLADLEDYVTECWEDRDARKSMSKNNATGLTKLRQKLRKYNRENLESELAAYRENPDEGDESEEEAVEESESDDDDEDDAPMANSFLKSSAPPTKAAKPAPDMDDEDDDDDDDIDWGSDDDDSTSSSDDEAYEGNLAARFLKRTSDTKEKKDKTIKKEKKDRKKTKKAEDDDEEGWQVAKPMSVEKTKMFAKDQEITHEAVGKKLLEIIAVRGKKGTDRNDQISLLNELRDISSKNNLGIAMDCKILFHVVAAIFDYNASIATCMKPEMWEQCLTTLNELLGTLIANPDIVIGENVQEDTEVFDKSPYRVRGCILTSVEKMDEEFVKMLQACDAHSTEYVDRLKDEARVYDVIKRLQEYLEGRSTTEEVCRVYLKRIQHMYYKFDNHLDQNDKEDTKALMEKLTKFIYTKDTTDRIRTHAILCHIYHHALHDRWFEARDLMLMSHLQDNIQHSDVPTQIMYNRAMVQLGLCSFRQGTIRDAHNCLVDIQSGGRAKELLAQGLLLQRQHERTAEQEKIEKRRQMPYHMHINLELLECVYLVSAMLLEIPYMAAHEFDARRRMISKNFHHVLRVSERQPLVGPPESMREHVVAASKAMKTGDWKACRDFIINEKMNAKVWDLFYEADRVREMIASKIQEESLRTYLFTYSNVYDSLSLATLSEMFELEQTACHSVISKMIINEELMASLDEPTQTIVMHRTEPTRLQSLALQLSEKVANLVEHNEKIMEIKQGGTGWFYPKGRDGQNYENRGGYQKNYNRDGNREGGYQKNYNRDGNREGGYQKGYRGDNQGKNYNYYGGRKNQNRDRGNRYEGGGGRYQQVRFN